MTTLIHNVEIVNEGERFYGHVLVDGEFISAVGRGDYAGELPPDTTLIDGHGKLLLPGVIDTHVHFRDPGLTHKADMESESRAAVAGGVTSFIDMPNTKPATTTVVALEAKLRHASEVSLANYGFFIGATSDNLDQLKAADYTRCAGVKLFMGSSTGGMLVDSLDIMKRIMAEVPALVAVHAEDEGLLRKRCEAVVARYGEDLPMEFHPVIREIGRAHV